MTLFDCDKAAAIGAAACCIAGKIHPCWILAPVRILHGALPALFLGGYGMEAQLTALLAMREERLDDPFVHYAIAIQLRAQGALDRSLRFFEYVQRRFPEYLPNYLHHAQLLTSLGRRSEAVKVLTDGIELAERSGDVGTLSELQDVKTELTHGVQAA